MNLEKLSVLKDKLVTAKDFKEPWNYFFDHFGENPAFIRLGQQTTNPVLKEAVTQIGQKIFQREDISVAHLLLAEIKAHHFIHGGGLIEGHFITLFYFTNIDMGLFAMSMGGGNISLARFTSMKIETGHNVFLAPTMNSVFR